MPRPGIFSYNQGRMTVFLLSVPFTSHADTVIAMAGKSTTWTALKSSCYLASFMLGNPNKEIEKA